MYRPERRSKKIGRTQGGRVQDGRAAEKWSRAFGEDLWTRLSEASGECQILRENPSREYYHPCSGQEYVALLGSLPKDLASPVKAVVLRRTPKLDEELGVEARKRYFCIVMNSFPRSREYVWPDAPTQGDRSHFDPWCSDWQRRSNGRWVLRWTKDEVRRYFLYHLFLHELGHFHQPDLHSNSRREQFAEQFALEWARKLGEL